jgi:hypothetical protein
MPPSAARPRRSGRSILGTKGQASVDPLVALFRAARPASPISSWVRCQARQHPRQMGVRRCQHRFCPRCHAEQQKHLRRKLTQVFTLAQDSGAGLAFLTLTAPHRIGQALSLCAETISRAWERARTGSPFKRLKSRYALLGTVSVIDVTFGEYGWYFHLHTVVFTKHSSGALRCGTLLAERYQRLLRTEGEKTAHATADVRCVTNPEGLAAYFSKTWRLPANDRAETPLNLLERAFAGSIEAFDLFLEAVEAFQGKKRGVVSPTLCGALQELMRLRQGEDTNERRRIS